MRFYPLYLILLFGLTACPSLGYKYDIGDLPSSPQNLTSINSAYDDYNSSAPSLGETFPLCFSSNRNTQGGEFDVVYKMVRIRYDRDDGSLDVSEETNGNLDIKIYNSTIGNAISKMWSLGNEFGPYLIPISPEQRPEEGVFHYNGKYIMIYSNDQGGDHELYFLENADSDVFTNPKKINYLNSDANDAYFTLDKDYTSVYFTSDRDGNFDIYRAELPQDYGLIDNLNNDSLEVNIESVEVLNSEYEDKCPFILGDRLVFVSNRPGGFGGFDLYYCEWMNGEWSDPINFGSKINTEYDEYRPIIRIQEEFTSDFMIFSSNRPGGLGGFDLYYVGIDKMN